MMDSTIGRLHQAIKDYDTDRVIQIIKEPGINVNETHNRKTSLTLAIEKEHYEVVKILLEAGADINAESYCPQYCTIEKPIVTVARVYNKDLFDLLLEQDTHIDPRCDGHKDALQWAVTHGDIQMTEDLLRLGADVNWLGQSGMTSLHYATSGGHINIVKLLLEKGAEVTVNNEWRSPLHIACYHNKLDILRELLKQKPNVSNKDLHGETPLSAATAGDHERLIEELLPYVYPSELSFVLEHAISSAVKRNAFRSTKLLLENGAQPNTRIDLGSVTCPLIHVVCRKLNTGTLTRKMLNLLLKFGAKLNAKSLSYMGPSYSLLYEILLNISDVTNLDILIYHGIDVASQIVDLDRSEVSLIKPSLVEDVCHQIRYMVGSMYHDAFLWDIYRSVLPEIPMLYLPDQPHSPGRQVLENLTVIPTLMALSRSQVRRNLAIVSDGKTIVPLIGKLQNIPSVLVKYLLLQDVIQLEEDHKI